MRLHTFALSEPRSTYHHTFTLAEFRSTCLQALRKRVVTLSDAANATDQYAFFMVNNIKRTDFDRRLFKLLISKYQRTSFHASENSQSQRCLVALASHRRIETRSRQQPLDHPAAGRRTSTTSGGYVRRFLSGLVSDLFGYQPNAHFSGKSASDFSLKCSSPTVGR